MIGLVTYMCACLYRFGMSGHHQMHFIDVHIIIFSKSLLVFTAKDYIIRHCQTHCIIPSQKLHFHLSGNSKSLQEELVEPQLDNRDSMH